MPTLPNNPFVDEPTFDISPDPAIGNAPFEITISNLVIDMITEGDSISVASGGYSHSKGKKPVAEEVTTGGFFMHPRITSFYWDFGNGDQSFVDNPVYTYTTPGTYILQLVFFYKGVAYTVDVLVRVTQEIRSDDDDDPALASSPTNFIDSALHYGNNPTDGFGWSEFGGDNYVWPENGESVVTAFVNEDQIDIAYHRRDGLPYIINPRKDSNIGESFRDRVDPLQPLSGYDISGHAKGEVLRGTDELFSIRPMEIGVFIRPLFQDYKVEDPNDGLFDGLEIDMFMYRDQKVSPISGLKNIDYNKAGQFFADEQKKEAQLLEFEFVFNKGRFRFDRYTVKLVAYDKALYLHTRYMKDNILFPAVDTIVDTLYKIILFWLTRYKHNINIGIEPSYGTPGYDEVPTPGPGPDGNSTSAFFSDSVPITILNAFLSAPSQDVYLWSDDQHPFVAPLVNFNYVTVHKAFDRDSVTWYFLQASSTSASDLKGLKADTLIFDYRIMDRSNVTQDIIDFMADNVENKNADDICPL